MKRYTLGSSSIGALEKQYVTEVLDNNFISPGPVVAEVEKLCAELHNMRHCVTLNSGQSAIQVGLQALIQTKLASRRDVVKEKPLVAVPACTYISTLAAAIYARCDIVLVDVELETGNMCPDALEATIQELASRYKSIDIVVPVHLYGKACNHRIRDICWENNLLVLEDACEATLTPFTGWGHVLTTSFFSNHLISGGSGGAIMTNDPEIDLYCWKLINHGREARFNNDDIYQIADKFRFDIWGHSYKWSDVNAAIVKAQLERHKELFCARRQNAEILLDSLGLTPLSEFVRLPNPDGHCFMMFPIILADSLDASKLIKGLNDRGVETRKMMPITNQPIVTQYLDEATIQLDEVYPHAAIINRQGFYVGCHPELSDVDMQGIGQAIVSALMEQVGNE